MKDIVSVELEMTIRAEKSGNLWARPLLFILCVCVEYFVFIVYNHFSALITPSPTSPVVYFVRSSLAVHDKPAVCIHAILAFFFLSQNNLCMKHIQYFPMTTTFYSYSIVLACAARKWEAMDKKSGGDFNSSHCRPLQFRLRITNGWVEMNKDTPIPKSSGKFNTHGVCRCALWLPFKMRIHQFYHFHFVLFACNYGYGDGFEQRLRTSSVRSEFHMH